MLSSGRPGSGTRGPGGSPVTGRKGRKAVSLRLAGVAGGADPRMAQLSGRCPGEPRAAPGALASVSAGGVSGQLFWEET